MSICHQGNQRAERPVTKIKAILENMDINTYQEVNYHQGSLQKSLLGEGATILLIRTHLLGEINQNSGQGVPGDICRGMISWTTD